MDLLRKLMTKTSFLFLWLTMLVAQMGGHIPIAKRKWAIVSKGHRGVASQSIAARDAHDQSTDDATSTTT